MVNVVNKPILEALINKYSAEKIILFGSYARGEATESSDLDLVVIKKTETPFLQRLKEVALLLNKTQKDQPLDIIVYTPDEFEALSKRWNPFFHRILREGKIIYG